MLKNSTEVRNIMDLIHMIIKNIMGLVHTSGYFGVFIASGIEYACVPAPPSEVIIPFISAMAAKGEYNLIVAYLTTIFGGVIGSLTTYLVGYLGGRKILNFIKVKIKRSGPIINKIGILFEKHGNMVVLIARVMPFTRAYISLVAGVERLNIKYFIIFTSIGIGIWNGILFILGYFFGSNIKYIFEISKKYIYIIVIIFVILFIGYILYKILKKKSNNL